MIIEQNTNYAYKLKYMENPTFDKVRDLAIKFMRELPKQLQDELYEALNRGVDILDSEPQMVTYLYAFGPMHQAKLNYAFKHLPEEFLEQPEINIIDYGCGQALGTMCYADYLRENGYTQKVKVITLIEPSEMCLKRAALHASVFFPDAEIKTVNKSFDDLTTEDLFFSFDDEIPNLNILSNVLDILDFNLDKFSQLLRNILGDNNNLFLCMSPYFKDYDKDIRMRDFSSAFCNDFVSKVLDKKELNPEKDWTCQMCCFSTGKTLYQLSTNPVMEMVNPSPVKQNKPNSIVSVQDLVSFRNHRKMQVCTFQKANQDTGMIEKFLSCVFTNSDGTLQYVNFSSKLEEFKGLTDQQAATKISQMKDELQVITYQNGKLFLIAKDTYDTLNEIYPSFPLKDFLLKNGANGNFSVYRNTEQDTGRTIFLLGFVQPGQTIKNSKGQDVQKHFILSFSKNTEKQFGISKMTPEQVRDFAVEHASVWRVTTESNSSTPVLFLPDKD